MSTNESRCQDLLIDYGFDNSIDDLPEITAPKKKRIGRPPLENKEMDKLQNKREALFRSWLVSNKPESAVMVPIETTTATGVPDIFACYSGKSFWFECKSLVFPALSYVRGTQYIFLKKLVEAGGNGKVITQYLNLTHGKPVSIQIYNAADIVCHPLEFFKQSGERLYFPRTLKPNHIWHYTQRKEYTVEYLYQLLFLDNEEIIW